jgi:hypothetical protein
MSKSSSKKKQVKKPAATSEPQPEYEVECIRAIAHDHTGAATYCLVQWKAFDEAHTGWEPMTNITHSSELLKEAEQRAKDGAKWKWEYYLDKAMDGMEPGWHPYDATAADSMSKYFSSWCKDTDSMAEKSECVQSGHFMYEIDFKQMKQKNIRVAPFTERPIRCIPQ